MLFYFKNKKLFIKGKIITFDQTVKTIAVAETANMMQGTLPTDIHKSDDPKGHFLKEEQLGGITVPIMKPLLLNH